MSRGRFALLALLHLGGLSAIVVAQPLFDLLARSPEFFVAHEAGPAEILLAVAFLVCLVPAALTGAAWLFGLLSGRRTLGLETMVGGLTGLLALQVLKRTAGGSAVVVLPAAAAAGLAAGLAYRRWAAVRTFMSALSVAVLVVPAVFLIRPAYRSLLAPASSPGAATAPSGEVSPIPVVMIVLDETPLASLVDAEGSLDEATFPHLAALARDGIWFRNATTVCDYTWMALPAILTGQLPRPGALATATDYPNSLFTLLAPSHRVESLEVTSLCPKSVCGPSREPVARRLAAIGNDLWIVYQHLVLPNDLTEGLPKLGGDWARFAAADDLRRRRRTVLLRNRADWLQGRGDNPRDRVAVARRFVERITADEPQPRFYFFHSMGPHTPYVLLPNGQVNATLASPKVLDPPRLAPGRSAPWTTDEWVLAVQYQRHLLQVAHFDSIIGDVTRRLREHGLYERSLILVLSDHGAAFSPGIPRRDFTGATAAEILPILLVAKLPGGVQDAAGGVTWIDGQAVSDRNVETIDIAPTVADALGVELPWSAAGVSFLDGSKPDKPSKVVYYDSARKRRCLDRRGPDITPVVRRKFALFGSDNPYRVPRPPRYADLLGRPVPELNVVDGEPVTVVIDYLPEFLDWRAEPGAVPFDVAGRIAGRSSRRGAPPVYLAVAVNGTVRAVTRTWIDQPDAWLATPPLTAWREGANDLQVFLVDGDDSPPRLVRCTVKPGKKRKR